MIAPSDKEIPLYVGILAALNVFDPRAVDAKWNFILALASCRTSVATNALCLVDREAVVHSVARI